MPKSRELAQMFCLQSMSGKLTGEFMETSFGQNQMIKFWRH